MTDNAIKPPEWKISAGRTNTHLGLSVILLVAPALTLLLVMLYPNPLQNNVWSLSAIRTMLGTDQRDLGPVPIGHPHGSEWRARYALQQGDSETALFLMSERLEEQPDNVVARSLLGAAFEQKGQMWQAVSEWRKAKDWRAILNAGHRAYVERRWDDALLAYQAAWELMPSESTTGLSHTLYFGKKDSAKAEAVLRASLQTTPEYTDGLVWRFTLAEILESEKRWRESAFLYQEILEREPQNAIAHIRLGRVLYYTGEHVQAIEIIQKGIDLAPSKPDGYEMMARLFTLEKRYSEADQSLANAIQLSPDTPRLWIMRAMNSSAAGDLSSAVIFYREVSTRFSSKMTNKEMASIHLNLAHLYWRMNDGAQASSAIEKALSLNNSDPLLWTTAGAIYEWLKEPGKALHAYREALQLDSTNQSAQEGVRRLQ